MAEQAGANPAADQPQEHRFSERVGGAGDPPDLLAFASFAEAIAAAFPSARVYGYDRNLRCVYATSSPPGAHSSRPAGMPVGGTLDDLGTDVADVARQAVCGKPGYRVVAATGGKLGVHAFPVPRFCGGAMLVVEEPTLQTAEASMTALCGQQRRELAEMLTRRFFDATPVVAMIKDLSGKLLAVSDGACELLQRSREELLGTGPETRLRVDPEWAAQVWARDQAVLRSDAPIVSEEILPTIDTTPPKRFLVARFPIHNDDGETVAIGLVAQDLTVTDTSLRSIRGLLEVVPDALIVCDRNGKIELVNSQAEQLSGYARDELIGQRAEILGPPQRREAYRRGFEEYVSNPGARRFGSNYQVKIARKGGAEVPVEVSIAPLLNAAGELDMVSILLRDLTEQWETERKLKRQAEELRRSNTDLEHFASAASHDLQEPLRVIATCVDVLDRHNEHLDDTQKQAVRIIGESAKRMTGQISELLNLARVGREGAITEQVRLDEAIRAAIDGLRVKIDAAGAQINLPDGEAPVVEANARHLGMVFQNLIGNAVKFRHPDRSPVVDITWEERQDGTVVVTVRDNGIGFDPMQAERIFEPFRRLHGDDEYDGSGIGLPLARKLVEAHGGTVTAKGEPGAGATFTVCLPGIPVRPD
jgi:PAS domain S-box-containing protein